MPSSPPTACIPRVQAPSLWPSPPPTTKAHLSVSLRPSGLIPTAQATFDIVGISLIEMRYRRKFPSCIETCSWKVECTVKHFDIQPGACNEHAAWKRSCNAMNKYDSEIFLLQDFKYSTFPSAAVWQPVHKVCVCNTTLFMLITRDFSTYYCSVIAQESKNIFHLGVTLHNRRGLYDAYHVILQVKQSKMWHEIGAVGFTHPKSLLALRMFM